MALSVWLMAAASLTAGTVIGPWVPMFKGIDYVTATNSPGGGGFAEMQVAHALRVDLSDPDVQPFTTPPCANFIPSMQEAPGMTVSDFVSNYGVQVAVNANFFNLFDQFAPAWTPMELYGLHISRGQLVSSQEGPDFATSLVFTTNHQASIIANNWPPQPTDGIFTAVTGSYPLLLNNQNLGYQYLGNPSHLYQLNPRTAVGLSQDRRYLYVLAIDGRQPGVSDGAYDWETAAWLQLFGASDGVNLDGGGSSTMVMRDGGGNPVMLNNSSSVLGFGLERTVPSHLGFYAKPLPPIVNLSNVTANPDDTAATVTWTTLTPSTSQVQYGPATNLSQSSTFSSALATNHAVRLANLTPGSGYYFQAISTAAGAQYVSASYFFVTTNYLVTRIAIDMTNAWTYSATNLDGVSWTCKAYDDSGWTCSGPGLLSVGSRTNSGGIPGQPRENLLAADPRTGMPFPTYYFRTHFNVPGNPAGISLVLSNYISDGAVFYLNGAELHRLRMPAAPATITNSTAASGTPCNGMATCPDVFTISGDVLTNLVSGDNILSVEVHDYPDDIPQITFGSSLILQSQVIARPTLKMVSSGSNLTLSWNGGGYVLQQADSPAGPWKDVAGPVVSSPFATANSAAARFYRLSK